MDRAGEPCVRKVKPEDRAVVAELTKDLFGGKDYVNTIFDDWVAKGAFYGLEEFPGGPLVAIANVRKMSCGGYVEGVRVGTKYHRRGYGAKLLEALMQEAADGEELIYQCFDANTPSVGLAKRSGFELSYAYRYSSVTPEEYTMEPWLSAFPGKTIQEYWDDVQAEFGPLPAAAPEIADETSLDSVIEALQDIRPGRILFQQQLGVYGPDDFEHVFRPRGYVAMISPTMVSIGRTEENHDPLGKLLSYTIYFGTREEPTREELLSHVAQWMTQGIRDGSKTLSVHLVDPPPSLEAEVTAIFGRKRDILGFGYSKAKVA